MASSASEAGEARRCLGVVAGGLRLAIELPAIREIIEPGALVPVPATAACWRGVMNLRGAVVPILDLGLRLGLPSCGQGRRRCVVIVEHGDGDVGLLVDEVSAVTDLPGRIETPTFGSRVPGAFLRGVVVDGESLVTLLDVGALLAFENAPVPEDVA